MKTIHVVFLALVALSIVGVVATTTDTPWAIARPFCWCVIFAALFYLFARAGDIYDTLRVPAPPDIRDPVLGPLAHAHGFWSASLAGGSRFWVAGRRRGPDPELVRAGAAAAARVGELEARARALAAAGAGGEPPVVAGPFTSLSARRSGAGTIEIVLHFDLEETTATYDDHLDVVFVGEEPSRIDVH